MPGPGALGRAVEAAVHRALAVAQVAQGRPGRAPARAQRVQEPGRAHCAFPLWTEYLFEPGCRSRECRLVGASSYFMT